MLVTGTVYTLKGAYVYRSAVTLVPGAGYCVWRWATTLMGSLDDSVALVRWVEPLWCGSDIEISHSSAVTSARGSKPVGTSREITATSIPCGQ